MPAIRVRFQSPFYNSGVRLFAPNLPTTPPILSPTKADYAPSGGDTGCTSRSSWESTMCSSGSDEVPAIAHCNHNLAHTTERRSVRSRYSEHRILSSWVV